MNIENKTILITGTVCRYASAAANELEVHRGTYVPSMHRKHSSNGRRSRIHRRNAGGVYRQD